jgi:hypothetical protein
MNIITLSGELLALLMAKIIHQLLPGADIFPLPPHYKKRGR